VSAHEEISLLAARNRSPQPAVKFRNSTAGCGTPCSSATNLAATEKPARYSWPWWRWAVTGLSALALALSAYLGWHNLTGAAVIGCGVESSCDHVLNSRWSVVADVLPVSGLAGGTYLALLLAGFFIGPATALPIRRLAWGAMLILVGAAAGSAVWFTILQKWVIGAFCPYCMATHFTGLLLAILVIWQAIKQLDDATTEKMVSPITPRRLLGTSSAMSLALLGLALAGVVSASQIYFKPPAVYRDGGTQNNLTALDPRVGPLVGSPDAPYIVNLLFDYNCPHCQQVHLMLDEAIRRYGGKLAFTLCPTPLNTRCNPYIPRDVPEFADSCELAQIGLAVWFANRGAFPAFDRWMFSFESGDRWQPRSLAAAKAKAVELVGQEKFDMALADPWIDRYLQTSIRIYGNTVHGGNTAAPKLVFGSRWVVPEPNDAEDLVSILHASLAVPVPGPLQNR
jgi:uncharacterized membrane protein/protein-disulfide isomerase